MYCNYCGKQLPDDSVFCSGCGKKLVDVEVTAKTKEQCHIELFEIEEKWSLYGKTYNTFRAVRPDGTIVLDSEKFKLSGFAYNGPEQSSKKYRDIFDKFLLQLSVEGWKKLPPLPQKRWYELELEKE